MFEDLVLLREASGKIVMKYGLAAARSGISTDQMSLIREYEKAVPRRTPISNGEIQKVRFEGLNCLLTVK